MKNYYEILGIAKTASVDEIKKAYRQKAIKYHPDKHFNDKYFAEKFIEVKEAYDVLSNISKKTEYDTLYSKAFSLDEVVIKENAKKTTKQTQEKEEQFFYDPYKPFYSVQDRASNTTPQFKPKYDHWGSLLPENADFFKLPKNIGKIISGYTTLSVGENPASTKERTTDVVKSVGVALLISAAIIFFFKVDNPIWIGIWLIVPSAIAYWMSSVVSSFKHVNTFIGVNGFAGFKCEETRENVNNSYEVNFNDITDLLKATEIRKQNFNYVGTAYNFVWLKDSQVVKDVSGIHSSKENTPEHRDSEFWINELSERYWTVYLLDNMEKELEKKGYTEFSLFLYENGKYEKIPYIQLGIGYIKFKSSKGDTTYNFNEIKKIYTKGTNMFIEHSNYEKNFLFFESGNKNGIPLMNLSNRQFFYRAMELLLGYKFS